jgi:hypothetical protein
MENHHHHSLSLFFFLSLSTTLKPIHPSRKSVSVLCVCVCGMTYFATFFVIATPTHNSADLV